MDAVSGLFLNALGTDMVTMEEYFPFITKAFDIMQYTAWAVLFLIVVWQLFRAFGGPITEAENPWQLVVRGAIFALLIGYAKPIFMLALDIARAPYTALMDVSMTAEEFTFAGVEQVLSNGLLTIVSTVTVVGPILVLILLIALGWNYFKLLLEAVERYIVVGVLCYTSPLAFCMGGSKATNQVFKSWCRMVGSQLLLLVMNVWFIRGFNSSVGQYIGNGGALSTGQGSIFLWLFCALAFLKTAQKFDSYMAAMGLNVAQTGSSMGMELLMAARVISGVGHSAKSAGSVFGRGGSTATGTGAAASGFASGFASRFKGNSYVRDAVVDGGTRMGMGGGVGFVGRVFGGVAARNGEMITGESISSVAARPAEAAGTIAGDIADRSLGNYMPQLAGHTLKGTQISGGHISTTATGTDGKVSSVEMFNTAQFEKPAAPHSVVTATDGSTWYQMASGEGRNAFYDAPGFTGSPAESEQVAAAFPGAAEGTVLRNTGDGIMEASSESGNSLWYNSAYYNEPDAPHTVMQAANGVDWYAMQQHAEAPAFEQGEAADAYNQAAFRNFMPGFEQQVAHVDGTHREDGHFEVRHADGSGTAFYDTARFAAPRGDYQVYEDVRGQQWIAIHTLVCYARISELLSSSPEFNHGKEPNNIDEISIIDLSVRFSENVILHSVNMHFEKGKIYGVAGNNGTGKTTLINILAGLYRNCYSGKIILNRSISLSEINPEFMRKNLISVCPQDISLIEGSLRSNLLLGHDEPDDFYNTLEYFGLDSVIASLPNGINTSVDNHNFNLSAGEKQKIAIVRTIIKGGCVLIFDEPTSALDTLTRDRFLAYLQNHKKNKMVIIVSHDITLLQQLDEVVRMEGTTFE